MGFIAAGLDVGRKSDRSVLSILDDWRLVWVWKGDRVPFPRQVATIGSELVDWHAIIACVDAAGMGAPVVDYLLSAQHPVVPVNISTGRLRIASDNAVSIGHLDLFQLLKSVMFSGLFSVSPDCPHQAEMKAELKALMATFTTRGGIHVAAKAGHDDFAFSLALAVLAATLARIGHGKVTRQAASLGRGSRGGEGGGQGARPRDG